MPRQGSFISDLGEQFAELGKSTVKSTGQAIKQTFSPLSMAETLINGPKVENKPGGTPENSEKGPGKDHTPLDIQKLQEKQQKNDSTQIDAVRKRLFQMTKKDEQGAIDSGKKAEQDRTQAFTNQQQLQQQRQSQLQQASGGDGEAHGKQKKGMFTSKQKAQQKHTETKPSVSKD